MLVKEPHSWTPKQIGEMTMDELDLAFTTSVDVAEPSLSLDQLVESVKQMRDSAGLGSGSGVKAPTDGKVVL
jgi:hypothetical protein